MCGNEVPKRKHRGLEWLIERVWIGILCGTLAAQPIWSQSASDGGASSGQVAPSRLQIKVLTPVPLTEPAGALSANHVAVQILDPWGMPVPRATVSFRLPEAGPGGVFLNGLSTEVAIADGEGKASVQGFDWRAEAGSTFLHVVAAYGEVRAGAMIEVQLSRKAEAPPTVVSSATPKRSEQLPASAFPVPQPAAAEATAAQSRETPVAQAPETRARPVIGQVAAPATRRNDEVLASVRRAPREETPPAPPPDFQSAKAGLRDQHPARTADASRDLPSEAESASYVKVKRKSGGGSKLLLLLLVAGAAAGGAVAAGMSGGSGGSNPGPGNPSAPPVSIGTPTVIVTGGN